MENEKKVEKEKKKVEKEKEEEDKKKDMEEEEEKRRRMRRRRRRRRRRISRKKRRRKRRRRSRRRKRKRRKSLNLINNMGENMVFLSGKMLYSDHFSILFAEKNAQISSVVKPQKKIISFHFSINKNMDILFLLDRTNVECTF